MRKLITKQTGDTIVEVMIAIVVISTVLAGAFLVSRSSLKHVRDSEEHSQALKLLQGQVEQLRAQMSTATSVPASISSGSDFCFDTTTALQSGTCAAGPNNLYTLSTKDTTPASTGAHTFVSSILWPSITGSNAREDLVFRLNLP